MVYYQLIYGKYPFSAAHPDEILKQIKNGVKFEGVSISPTVRKFIERCLKVNPKERMSWAELYDDPLINSSDIKPVTKEEHSRISENKMFYSQE